MVNPSKPDPRRPWIKPRFDTLSSNGAELGQLPISPEGPGKGS